MVTIIYNSLLLAEVKIKVNINVFKHYFSFIRTISVLILTPCGQVAFPTHQFILSNISINSHRILIFLKKKIVFYVIIQKKKKNSNKNLLVGSFARTAVRKQPLSGVLSRCTYKKTIAAT